MNFGKTSFILSYLNNITALTGAIFTADMLRKDLPRDVEGSAIYPEFEKIILSVDAAIKKDEARDESSIATLGLTTNPNTNLPQLWVLKVEVDHWGNMEVLEHLE